MAQLSTLPNEILEDILTRLWIHEQKAARLVCSRFALLLERFVFKSLVISIGESYSNHGRFRNEWSGLGLLKALATSNARVAQHTTKLKLRLREARVYRQKSGYRPDTPKMATVKKYLVKALAKLEAVQAVHWTFTHDFPYNSAAVTWLNSCHNLHELALEVMVPWQDPQPTIPVEFDHFKAPNPHLLRRLVLPPQIYGYDNPNPGRQLVSQFPNLQSLIYSSPYSVGDVYELLVGLAPFTDLESIKASRFDLPPSGPQIQLSQNLHTLNMTTGPLSRELINILIENGIWHAKLGGFLAQNPAASAGVHWSSMIHNIYT